MELKPKFFMPFFLLSLITGILGGWYRMGWEYALPAAAGSHGLFMVGGFMGSVITLERMITMKKKWWLLFPALCALAVILGLVGQPFYMVLLQSIAALGIILFYFHHLQHDRSNYWYILSLGAASWLIGNLYFLITDTIPFALPWWVGFILFTILGERLELTRFLPISKQKIQILYVLLALAFVSLLLPLHGAGQVLYPISLLGLTLWYATNDMALKSIKKPGYSRYLAVGVLTGYGWLAIHALTFAFFFREHSWGYDVFVHTFFLGFGFSMIWAHGPMILPAVLKVKNRPFHSILWVFWSLFQLTLLTRILTSLLELDQWRKLLGMLNGISMLLIFGAMVVLLKWMNRK